MQTRTSFSAHKQQFIIKTKISGARRARGWTEQKRFKKKKKGELKKKNCGREGKKMKLKREEC